ncbi:RNA polymerase sigma-70 factor [Spirosoma validum]|uniref:RNA polymerase sigma-70 factor n=1 Tax=Spirosoma validum TaxID=2771355 RepID=A0A927GFA8_9BACT|nr:RNA polymerase sigma-70 factor [Spirosoma validum]MBD2755425.1 RNA polymerase sigma-70 factor [Spirosoma validum]
MSQLQPLYPDQRGKPIKVTDPDHSESRVVDSELFIRQAFDRSVREGYELLFRRYYRPLCNHAVRFVQSKEQAEDLVSEVFSNFWKGQLHLHITTSIRAYLFRALRNRIYNHLRDEFAHQRPTEDFLMDIAETEDPQQILQYTELYHRVQTVVSGLPPQCQRVFLLSRFESKKHKEIADELSISVKAVEMHITKALSLLRTALFSIWLVFLLGDLIR